MKYQHFDNLMNYLHLHHMLLHKFVGTEHNPNGVADNILFLLIHQFKFLIRSLENNIMFPFVNPVILADVVENILNKQ